MTINRVGKFYRFRLADFQSFGEVNVLGWAKDCSYAMVEDYSAIMKHELFDSERDALEAAVQRLRDEELRLYNERRALMQRLDQIEQAEVDAENVALLTPRRKFK